MYRTIKIILLKPTWYWFFLSCT